MTMLHTCYLKCQNRKLGSIQINCICPITVSCITKIAFSIGIIQMALRRHESVFNTSEFVHGHSRSDCQIIIESGYREQVSTNELNPLLILHCNASPPDVQIPALHSRFMSCHDSFVSLPECFRHQLQSALNTIRLRMLSIDKYYSN